MERCKSPQNGRMISSPNDRMQIRSNSGNIYFTLPFICWILRFFLLNKHHRTGGLTTSSSSLEYDIQIQTIITFAMHFTETKNFNKNIIFITFMIQPEDENNYLG